MVPCTQGGLLVLAGSQAQPQRVLQLTGTRTQFRVTTARTGTIADLPPHHASP
ncbi:hypothetical protein SAMN05216532_0250 [Streptomyces sp. 2231.1]|uniref:hypothetical protein n=1 Tax=Streptomyces sp. 2231.1 TaxID=1855347 RepID=UPI00089CF993|nr:hypothetical protein [Streptomyces sp. 2231.1]SEC03149.1 hypothetical protein SAMN05216532_0250 [Streptomyces sp. 2231.1]